MPFEWIVVKTFDLKQFWTRTSERKLRPVQRIFFFSCFGMEDSNLDFLVSI